MKKIALIYMGGTFGCIGEPLAPMSARDFIPKLKEVLPSDLSIECFIAPVIKDSSACTPSDWLQLAQFMQMLQLQGFQHFVIIHGTDTLSYASAVMAQLFAESAHIVLTGSQYPLLTTDSHNIRDFTDALDNLNFALKSVINTPVGVYLAFNQQLIHAQTALKTHTTELNAFTGVNAECAVQHVESPLIIQEHHINKSKSFNCLNWMLQPIEQDLVHANIQQLCQNPPTCLILQGFGCGNISMNTHMIEALQMLSKHQCAIILTTQVPFGLTDQRYAISEWIKTTNILVSNALSHADLYAKVLKMYLKYDAIDQWYEHWND